MASATSSSSSRHPSLRLRIAVALALLSTLGIFTMALTLFTVLHESQEEFIDEELDKQLAYSMKVWRESPAAAFPNTPDMELYRLPDGPVPAEAPQEVPAAFARLAVGNHEVIVDGREHHVAVRRDNGSRYILAYDVEASEDRERALLVSIIIASAVLGLVALIAAYLLAGRLTRQLDHLASAVAQDSRDLLSGPGLDRELVTVARALDAYRIRQEQQLERERGFAANLSHEIRTPLTTIRTDAELLASLPALPDTASRRAIRIMAAVDRINLLATSLLHLAREMRPGARSEVGLAGAIASAWDALAAGSTPSAIDIAVAPDVVVTADPALLELVLRNLLDNARRFSDAGGTGCRLEGSRLTVTDSGPGFADADLPRIFDRFYTGRRGESGIGLALVSHVCDACGWRVFAGNTTDGHGQVTVDFGNGLHRA